jgi:hypothetical protein
VAGRVDSNFRATATTGVSPAPGRTSSRSAPEDRPGFGHATPVARAPARLQGPTHIHRDESWLTWMIM